MKTVNKSLETYLETEKKITSCDLYELVLDNGNKYYYADTDIDISFNGHTYLHNALLIKRQQVKIHDRVVVDTMTVTVQADINDKLEGLPFCRRRIAEYLTELSCIFAAAFSAISPLWVRSTFSVGM